ncbi:hypothetical protein C8R46DRAFT_1196151 [Mycena filopes]|nr:hypothetical protein C8R46DRAFT_1196151 [Mycena filopes]
MDKVKIYDLEKGRTDDATAASNTIAIAAAPAGETRSTQQKGAHPTRGRGTGRGRGRGSGKQLAMMTIQPKRKPQQVKKDARPTRAVGTRKSIGGNRGQLDINASDEGDEAGEDSASSYNVEDIDTETSEERDSGASTPVADLRHELQEVRARLDRHSAQEIGLLERLRQLGDPVDEEEDLKHMNENKRLASELSTERAERQRVEETLLEIRRDRRTPFVVPALFDAFVGVSHLTDEVQSSIQSPPFYPQTPTWE